MLNTEYGTQNEFLPRILTSAFRIQHSVFI